ncbi:hypothetical protein [Plasmodium yoelii yoelii]|uniref:Uncharacterized protein n=1 Tax=Plasmodium yoelii yoelii TaxID=73239 RepID=Q7R707_PLAYO|nr:hypothetical protein [Plasmodium yoelii yoelii]
MRPTGCGGSRPSLPMSPGRWCWSAVQATAPPWSGRCSRRSWATSVSTIWRRACRSGAPRGTSSARAGTVDGHLRLAGVELAVVQIGQRGFFQVDSSFPQHFLELRDLLVQCLDMVEHVIDGVGDGVRHVRRHAVGVEAESAGDGQALRFLRPAIRIDDVARNADHRGACGDGAQHDRIGADAGAVAHRDGAEYLGAGADHHAVAQRRMAFALLPAGAAQGHAVV